MSPETERADTVPPIIEVRGLRKWYPVRSGFFASLVGAGEAKHVKAVDGVDFTIRPGEVLGLAGESGCGMSHRAGLLSSTAKTWHRSPVDNG